ncbi:MAG TPA: DUF4349 domain-containing protein [Polyangiaceae bacterium]|jgi:hypothetical protein|nr:DUF4349 domain-containing protein [Polyangiaceae bacterium]
MSVASPAAPELAAGAPVVTASAVTTSPGGAATAEDVTPLGRMVISEVQLSLRADSPSRAAERASALASRAGGYVLSRDASSSENTVVRVAMVVRVPVEKLESVMGELRETGSLLDESRTGRDVTEEFSDTKAELGAKRKLEERLLGILGAAKSVKEMLEVEGELARVRGEADKLEGRTRYLQNRASLATITLSIVSPAQPYVPVAESVGSRLRNAFSESCSLGFQVTTSIIVALGAMAPFLVPVAAGLYLVLRHRRASRKAMLSA